MEATHTQSNDFMFDYSNIKTLPKKLAHYLGHSFIFDVIDKYETNGLSSFQAYKLKSLRKNPTHCAHIGHQ
jgi:6-pyruvoyl-tetrahydropterin synthase